MKLADYLILHGINATVFAKQIGVSKQTVYNYLAEPNKTNYVRPHVANLTKIVKATNGKVQVADFYPELWGNNEEFTGN